MFDNWFTIKNRLDLFYKAKKGASFSDWVNLTRKYGISIYDQGIKSQVRITYFRVIHSIGNYCIDPQISVTHMIRETPFDSFYVTTRCDIFESLHKSSIYRGPKCRIYSKNDWFIGWVRKTCRLLRIKIDRRNAAIKIQRWYLSHYFSPYKNGPGYREFLGRIEKYNKQFS